MSVERKVGSGYGDGYGEQRRAKYLEIAYKTAAGQPRLMRANVVSSRLYKLDAVDGGDAPELRSIIDSFTAWPTNLICQGQSNSGSVPVAGASRVGRAALGQLSSHVRVKHWRPQCCLRVQREPPRSRHEHRSYLVSHAHVYGNRTVIHRRVWPSAATHEVVCSSC